MTDIEKKMIADMIDVGKKMYMREKKHCIRNESQFMRNKLNLSNKKSKRQFQTHLNLFHILNLLARKFQTNQQVCQTLSNALLLIWLKQTKKLRQLKAIRKPFCKPLKLISNMLVISECNMTKSKKTKNLKKRKFLLTSTLILLQDFVWKQEKNFQKSNHSLSEWLAEFQALTLPTSQCYLCI